MGSREYCRTNYTDLASVRNPAESEMIQSVSGGAEVWVGLFRDRWLWSDNSPSSFRFFPDGTQPFTNEDPACIAMIKAKSGRWSERACDQRLPFLCKCPKALMNVKVDLRTTTSLDIHDPVIQQNIIKQMEQRINQANMTRQVSLRWTKTPVL
ncbi:hypothetical protein WMY93_025833 [Mugilogobius chulae]|uniref:C-type lectin domain-containing protein n=1 Tax=Mugilogobius chulae TaxID=88201 RepID=A0AAW0N846_9GOBI